MKYNHLVHWPTICQGGVITFRVLSNISSSIVWLQLVTNKLM